MNHPMLTIDSYIMACGTYEPSFLHYSLTKITMFCLQELRELSNFIKQNYGIICANLYEQMLNKYFEINNENFVFVMVIPYIAHI